MSPAIDLFVSEADLLWLEETIAQLDREDERRGRFAAKTPSGSQQRITINFDDCCDVDMAQAEPTASLAASVAHSAEAAAAPTSDNAFETPQRTGRDAKVPRTPRRPRGGIRRRINRQRQQRRAPLPTRSARPKMQSTPQRKINASPRRINTNNFASGSAQCMPLQQRLMMLAKCAI